MNRTKSKAERTITQSHKVWCCYIITAAIIIASFLIFCQKEKVNYVPGEVLIKFKTEAPQERINSLCSEMGLEKIKEFPKIGVTLYKITSNLTVKEVINRCRQDPHVEYAEPNYRYRIEEKLN